MTIKHITLVVPVLIFLLFRYSLAKITYNVVTFGAKDNGLLDSKNAFVKAWGLACGSTSPAIIYVPTGRYLIASALTFAGQKCKSKAITFKIDGTLVAPSSYNSIGNAEVWIKFYRVNHVTISGGTLDAQGAPLWACKSSGKTCPKGATVRPCMQVYLIYKYSPLKWELKKFFLKSLDLKTLTDYLNPYILSVNKLEIYFNSSIVSTI